MKERPYRLLPAAADDLNTIVDYLNQRIRWRPLTGAFRRYLVFYRESSDDHIDVIRVLHSAREIERILLSSE